MPCPYNANNNGYTWCQCQQLGPPFGLCVADSYYCGYYCQYAPSWIFTAIAKGAMLCPIDPAQIDPYKPDVVFPGWVGGQGGFLGAVRCSSSTSSYGAAAVAALAVQSGCGSASSRGRFEQLPCVP